MSRMAPGPIYIGSEIYRKSTYGDAHPLAVPRVSTVTDLCRAMGWLGECAFREAPMATPAQAARFHHPDYIAALERGRGDPGGERSGPPALPASAPKATRSIRKYTAAR